MKKQSIQGMVFLLAFLFISLFFMERPKAHAHQESMVKPGEWPDASSTNLKTAGIIFGVLIK